MNESVEWVEVYGDYPPQSMWWDDYFEHYIPDELLEEFDWYEILD